MNFHRVVSGKNERGQWMVDSPTGGQTVHEYRPRCRVCLTSADEEVLFATWIALEADRLAGLSIFLCDKHLRPAKREALAAFVRNFTEELAKKNAYTPLEVLAAIAAEYGMELTPIAESR